METSTKKRFIDEVRERTQRNIHDREIKKKALHKRHVTDAVNDCVELFGDIEASIEVAVSRCQTSIEVSTHHPSFSYDSDDGRNFRDQMRTFVENRDYLEGFNVTFRIHGSLHETTVTISWA